MLARGHGSVPEGTRQPGAVLLGTSPHRLEGGLRKERSAGGSELVLGHGDEIPT